MQSGNKRSGRAYPETVITKGERFRRKGNERENASENALTSVGPPWSDFSRAATSRGSMEAPESALQQPAFFPLFFLVKIVTIGHNWMPSGAARANLRGLFLNIFYYQIASYPFYFLIFPAALRVKPMLRFLAEVLRLFLHTVSSWKKCFLYFCWLFFCWALFFNQDSWRWDETKLSC